MGHFCAVFGCGHRGERDKVSFYRFPYAPKRFKESVRRLIIDSLKKWLAVIRRADLDENKLKYARVCSAHFHSGRPASLHDINNPDWAPCLKLGHCGGVKNVVISVNRYSRNLKRAAAKDIVIAVTSNDEVVTIGEAKESDFSQNIDATPDAGISAACQTTITADSIDETDRELVRANEEIYRLREALDNMSLTERSFERDPKKTLFYTGLPEFSLFMVIVVGMSPYLNECAISALSKFQQCLIFLMKIRLNPTFQDLAYRFNISLSTASRTFHNCLDIFFARYKYIVRWPDREELYQTMPAKFTAAFGRNVAIIIDCFEIFIETPSNLMAKCQTWSTYKHHNTVKFLIGISPQGSITYLSKGWGGRTSDKHIIEECGILNNLIPGDIIMADRGFNVGDAVSLHYAQVLIPAFTREKKQLGPLEVEQTRKIANLRIHVERVIGTVRQKYTILNGPISREMLSNVDKNTNCSTIDKIVMAACSLTSMCPSVVVLD